ncbi:unnamed protein product [Rotaria sp. Silwood1]|nr:unnamed protein product [Rotaria sp. Silwood1]CAF3453941.1 unnamed protein product [Rotaria sp. Silwood1]CAF3477986.1 unnamed protein product [Rotaria sp. Silwood1]CAF4616594.1 unnamed protein product [Rotaria sp. Silwood1]CAF4854949.1 unnamed protein product [Rotaria sp. Silwood1]
MIFLKFILIIGMLVTITDAQCSIAGDPKEVVKCVQHITLVLYGALAKDLKIICQVAADVSDCLSTEISDCVEAEIGIAALNEAKRLAENCCPVANSTSCPILSGSHFAMNSCFAADSLLTLVNGKQKQIIELQSGDTILAYDDKTNNLIPTNVLTMLDYQPKQYAVFKQLTTVSGRQLSLTLSHLLPTDIHGYVMAKNIRVGMNIYVMNDDGLLVTETISNVIDVVKQGYIAPLTQQGTLIVNNVAASCYATINNHHLAHVVLAPMRWWYGLFGETKVSDKTIGIHWFPNMLYEMTTFLMPSILQN